MHNISKECVFIFFVKRIYIIMWNGIWMVKILGCDKGSKGSNPILDMFCAWYYHDNFLFQVRWTQTKYFFNFRVNGFNHLNKRHIHPFIPMPFHYFFQKYPWNLSNTSFKFFKNIIMLWFIYIYCQTHAI
jgi:hypothetical protein